MKRSDKIFTLIIIGIVVLIFIGLFTGLTEKEINYSNGDKVFVIKLQGPILNQDRFIKKL